MVRLMLPKPSLDAADRRLLAQLLVGAVLLALVAILLALVVGFALGMGVAVYHLLAG